jgi:hypothetical protein
MKYIILILSLVIIVITGCQEASISPTLADGRGKSSSNTNVDFPNTVGSYWIYELKGINKYYTDTVEIRITGTTKLGYYDSVSVWSYFYRSQNYNSMVFYKIIPGKDGHDTVKGFPDNYLSALPSDSTLFNENVLIYPLTDGKKWNCYTFLHESNYKFEDSARVSYIPQVTVPAGTFDGIYQIQKTILNYPPVIYQTMDYCPNVGFIKIVEYNSQQEVDFIWQLIEYHIEK